MKLITAIIQKEDEDRLLYCLVQTGYRATKMSSTGGFLRRGNSTIILAAEDHQVDEVVGIVERNCQRRSEIIQSVSAASAGDSLMSSPLAPMEPGAVTAPDAAELQVGGAIIFVQNLDLFTRY